MNDFFFILLSNTVIPIKSLISLTESFTILISVGGICVNVILFG